MSMDIFNDDAFSLVSLTAAINEVEHVPGKAGERAFLGNERPVKTERVSVEWVHSTIELIPTSARGAPSFKEQSDKGAIAGFEVPHIQLEDAVFGETWQGVRKFGSDDLTTPMEVVHGQLAKMAARLDLTLEHLRLGAIKGQVINAQGDVLLDPFATFGVYNSLGQLAPELMQIDLSGAASDVRAELQKLVRYIKRKARMVLPKDIKIWALCGDDFFDALVSNPSIKRTYSGTEAAAMRLGGNYVDGVFEYGGVLFENYHGSDDQVVSIAPDECRFFLDKDAPGIWQEIYAPADFIETVNQEGVPRYAKLAMGKFEKYVELHVQSNPLPMCLRPQTLVRGVMV